MFKNNTIKREVMKVISQKIDAVQEEYENKLKDLEVTLEEEREALFYKQELDKADLIAEHVNKILDKVL